MTPRLFEVRTFEGSTFLVCFWPKLQDAGVWYGRLRVVGTSARYGYHLNLEATGCLPEPRGRIRVSNKVVEEFDIGDGTAVQRYETEEITEVTELPFPDHLPPP